MAHNRREKVSKDRSFDRACLHCQRRKTRCVFDGNDASCAYCTRSGNQCVITEPPSRTSLTRKNLEAAEARCKRLESLLRQVRPDLDIEGDLSTERQETGPPTDPEYPPSPTAAPQTADAGLTSRQTPVPSEMEWQESLTAEDQNKVGAGAHRQDGMASFGSSGYLGVTSGSSLLKSISLFLPPSRRTPAGTPPNGTRGLDDSTSRSHDFFFSARLATSHLHECLMDAYFIAYNPSYPIVHECAFRKQYRQRQRISARSPWHIVSYMVLALGEWVSGYCTDEPSVYYEAARARLYPEILEAGNMVIVQAMLLLGNYLQKRDRPNTGYNYIGIAYRVAIGLGLHRQAFSEEVPRTFTQQCRSVLFWILYCFDSGFSLTTGRPITVDDSFIDMERPKNIVNVECTGASTLPPEVSYPTTYSALIAQSSLALIANKAYYTLLSSRKNPEIQSSVTAMERMLQDWRNSLPAYFSDPNVASWFLGPRQVVLWKESNLRILILLAVQRRSGPGTTSEADAKKLQSTAAETIFDIVGFCQAYSEVVHTGLCWYVVYFLLQAILALGLSGASGGSTATTKRQGEDIPVRDDALAAAGTCLENVARTNKAAIQTLRILQRLRNKLGETSATQTQNMAAIPAADANAINPPPANVFSPGKKVSATSKVTKPFPTGEESAMAANRSPADTYPIAGDFVDNDWVATIDPSLHLFLDDASSINSWFQGMEGFPSTMDQPWFSYTNSGVSTIRSALPSQNLLSTSEGLSDDGIWYMNGGVV